jgi:hypothetical protein
MHASIYLMILIINVFLSCCYSMETQTILPNQLIKNRCIIPLSVDNTAGEEKFHFYKMQELDPSKKYEIRVSYAAVEPAFFRIELYTPQEYNYRYNSCCRNKQQHQRKLLNIEKVILSDTKYMKYIQISAKREGHSFDPQIESQCIHYNIIVEELVFGVMPKSSIPLLILLLSIVVFIVLIVKYGYLDYWIQHYIINDNYSSNSSRDKQN